MTSLASLLCWSRLFSGIFKWISWTNRPVFGDLNNSISFSCRGCHQVRQTGQESHKLLTGRAVSVWSRRGRYSLPSLMHCFLFLAHSQQSTGGRHSYLRLLLVTRCLHHVACHLCGSLFSWRTVGDQHRHLFFSDRERVQGVWAERAAGRASPQCPSTGMPWGKTTWEFGCFIISLSKI